MVNWLNISLVVVWFNFDQLSAHPDLVFTNDKSDVQQLWPARDPRGCGFSKGVHYWEVKVDRYDNHTDPAIEIARFDVDKCIMLGKLLAPYNLNNLLQKLRANGRVLGILYYLKNISFFGKVLPTISLFVGIFCKTVTWKDGQIGIWELQFVRFGFIEETLAFIIVCPNRDCMDLFVRWKDRWMDQVIPKRW